VSPVPHRRFDFLRRTYFWLSVRKLRKIPREDNQSSSNSLSLSPLPGPSLRMGILIPCVAKHLDNAVLSTTPGNLLAEYTVKGSEKQAARTGAEPVLTRDELFFPVPGAPLGGGGDGTPTLTNWKRSRNWPSVRTERSWSTNQIPILSDGSVNLKALAARAPMRFRVNIPCG